MGTSNARRGRIRVVATTFVVFALLQFGVGAASAEDSPEAFVEVIEPSADLTIEYGQYWAFVALGRYTYPIVPTSVSVTLDGAPSGYVINSPWQQHNTAVDTYINIYPDYEQAPLVPATYAMHVAVTSAQNGDNSAHPASLKVVPAALGTEVRILADPANTGGAIVTARFTGRFVDEYQSSFFPGAAISPAGIWHITLFDSDGGVVTERSVERAAGDDVLADSFYWTDAEPGQRYTATAEFTSEGASANNFSVAPASDFDYTAPESIQPMPTSTATAGPDTTLPEATGFSVPLWLIGVAGLIIVGLGVLVTTLSVRLSRRPTATTGEKSA